MTDPMSPPAFGALRRVRAGVLEIAYVELGPADGPPVVLSHGFPYDVHAYAEVAPILAEAGCRVLVPYLRGFGPTRFLSADTPRAGQQGAIGADLLALLDALSIPRAVLAGFDWGGTASCVAAALWPERCTGMISVNSYKIQDIAHADRPSTPDNEWRYWYQFYFHGERGRAGLREHRDAFCRLLWRLWSPTWRFDDATFARSAAAFDNPDFVDVVIHSYRHRFGLAAGDPAYDDIEARLAALPPIPVPAITFDGDADGVMQDGGTAAHATYFTGPHQHRVVAGVGHNLPQEAPAAFAAAALALARGEIR